MADYNMSTTIDGAFDEVKPRLLAALKEQGFGILSTIDMQAAMREKLGVTMERYEILGACNPPLAKKALEAELPIGVMLPCNVVVWETDEGKATVAAFNPMEAFPADASTTLKELADEVSGRLKRVLDRL